MKKINKTNLLILLVPFVFYVFFSIYDGPVWCDDTGTFVDFFGAREPLYPFCIAIFRLVFGQTNDFYLRALVMFQSLLMAYATYEFVKYIKNQFKTNALLTYGTLIILLSVSLMCRFIAKRGSMYSNSLLSESLSVPLYLLFIRYLLEYLINNSKKPFILSATMSFLLISTRKQLYSSLFLLIIVSIYVLIKNRKIKNGIIKLIVTCLLVLGANKTFDYSFMVASLGVHSTHTSGNRFITTMIISSADRDDAKYIEDEETKELFLQIYDVCKENDYLKDTSLSWYDRVDHFHEHYDHIQLDTLMPMMREYASNKTDANNVELLIDKYNDNIISSLFIKELPKMISTVVDNFFAGLTVTITADKEILVPFAVAIYAIYIVLLAISIKKNGLDSVALFSLLVILSILVNVGIISCVIFIQTRYTIYNLGIFYVSLILLGYQVLIKKRRNS